MVGHEAIYAADLPRSKCLDSDFCLGHGPGTTILHTGERVRVLSAWLNFGNPATTLLYVLGLNSNEVTHVTEADLTFDAPFIAGEVRHE